MIEMVVELIESIKQFILMSDPTTTQDMVKWIQYKDKRMEYERLAVELTRRFAKNMADKWIADLIVEKDVPEQIPPYLKSGMTGKYIRKERRVAGKCDIISTRPDLLQLKAAADLPFCSIAGRPLNDIDDLVLS
jgi:hypothetical protein